MIGTLLRNSKGIIENITSDWTPSEPVKLLTIKIKEDYQVGYNILHRTFQEFNNKNLIQRLDLDQKAYNSYVEDMPDNPDEDWRWNGVRPMTRNKVVALAAHLVSATLIPGIFAQNDMDEEDKKAADIMRCLVEWNIRNSNYEIAYRQAIVGALVNPVAYLHADYAEVLQTIKERMINGTITEKEVVDGVLSGFQAHSIPPEEILIANPHEYFLQRQRFIGRRKFSDYDILRSKYGDHPNWKFVKPGIKTFYDQATDTFYNQYDDSLKTLGEEFIYQNRTEDLEVPYVNGIYFGDINDVKNNPIKHRDNENRPKYPYAKTGFSLIDEGRFFYYKSLVFHMADDQELEDRVTRILVDSSVLEAMPPMAGIGTGNVGTGIMYPGQLTPFKKDSEIVQLGVGRNIANLYNLLQNIETQIDRDSISKTSEGQPTPGDKTKFEIQRTEINSVIQQGLFGRMIGDMVKDFGDLLVDIVLLHETVGQVDEKLGAQGKMTFRTFLLPNQTEGGKKITRKIRFKQEMIGRELTKTKRQKESGRIKKEQGKNDVKISEVNPQIFRGLKFKMFVDYETLIPKDKDYEDKVAIRNYQLMKPDPLFDQKQVSRDLADKLYKGESDKFLSKQEINPAMMAPNTPKREEARILPEV